MRTKYLTLCLIFLVFAIAGCHRSPKTNVTEFIVTLDEQPLEDANIGLIPKDANGVAAFGTTDNSGKCQTQTLFGRANGGTAAGEYVVTVSKLKEKPTGRNLTNPDTGTVSPEIKNVESLPLLYVNETTTPFAVEVKPGNNSFTLELKSNPGRRPK
ncbi:MAG: hypothetical protein LBJ67_10710 [Planctomycetaceae bacterium]|jgi:hypothetical protein|nr:hypothetical protein [Planctomycetaceae bacterium]